MNRATSTAAAPERIDRFRGEHAFLSNFHRRPFQWQGQTWSTSEAAFQAAKTDDHSARERIRMASSPAAAQRLGRRADLPDLRDALLATGNAELVEGNGWGDRYWGVCDGQGRNRLGRMLMAILDDIRARARIAAHSQHVESLRWQRGREPTRRRQADVHHPAPLAERNRHRRPTP